MQRMKQKSLPGRCDYQTAVSKYQYLKDSLGVNEDEVLLNLANAYFELNDTTAALQHYQQLTQSSNGKIKSLAQQQLGVTRNRQAKFEDALNHFKEAIKADPTNMDARYNYELLKRKLDEQKKQDQQQIRIRTSRKTINKINKRRTIKRKSRKRKNRTNKTRRMSQVSLMIRRKMKNKSSNSRNNPAKKMRKRKSTFF